MTVIIHLTKGFETLVDEIDGKLANHKWSAAASHNHETPYVGRRVGKKTLLMHRFIMQRMMGRAIGKSESVDHINGNTLDNRRCNLRLATKGQNARNRPQSKKKSGYKGAYWIGKSNKWWAKINVDYQQIHIGYFTEQVDAHRAYCIAALTHHGEFANFGTNSPFIGWTLEQLEAAA